MHTHSYATNYRGELVCACGDKLQRFMLTDADIATHTGHKRKLLEALSPGSWIKRDTLVGLVGTKNFTARISNLRELGYIIECRREGAEGGTFYQLQGKADHSTAEPRTCPNCGHRW